MPINSRCLLRLTTPAALFLTLHTALAQDVRAVREPTEREKFAALLSGCETRTLTAGATFSCASVYAHIASTKATPADALAFAAEPRGVRADRSITTTADAPYSAAGKSGLTRTVERRSHGVVQYSERLVALDLGQGTSWIFGCGFFARDASAETTRRCNAFLAEFALVGPSGFSASKASTPRFAGRQLAVPQGCTVQHANERLTALKCSDGEFTVLTVARSVESAMQMVLAQMPKRLPGATAAVRRSCEFDGARATCFSVETATDLVVFGQRELEGSGGAVFTCQQPRALRTAHEVCATLMSFELPPAEALDAGVRLDR